MIRAALIALLVGMALLDLYFVPGRFAIRSVLQGAAILIGLIWWSSRINGNRVSPFALLLAYVLVLLIGAPFSSDPQFVMLQIGSLVAVLLIATGFVVDQAERGRSIESPIIVTTAIVVISLIGISMLMWAQGSPAAYQLATGKLRFQGIYTEPATLALSAGLLIGLALFGFRRSGLLWMAARGLLVIVGLMCFYEAGSRTFMIAASVGSLYAIWVAYHRYRRQVIQFGIPALLVAVLVVGVLEMRPVVYEDVVRPESLGTLTGRTDMWKAVVEVIPDSPMIGFGFTLGAGALLSTGGVSSSMAPGASEYSQVKLHSGYVQALMESGVLGAGLYLALFAVGAWRLYRSPTAPQYPFLCFALAYFAIANFAETIVHGGSVFRSVLGWVVLVAALGIVRADTVRAARSAHLRGPQRGSQPLVTPAGASSTLFESGRPAAHPLKDSVRR